MIDNEFTFCNGKNAVSISCEKDSECISFFFIPLTAKRCQKRDLICKSRSRKHLSKTTVLSAHMGFV